MENEFRCTDNCDCCEKSWECFCESAGNAMCEMWDAKYPGSFVDYHGEAIYIQKVVSNPAKGTVAILWNDGKATVGKCNPGDEKNGVCKDTFNTEMGMLVAILKRVMTPARFRELMLYYTPEDGKSKTISEVRKEYKANH